MFKNFDRALETPIQWLVVAGFISLPYTHLKWIPDLGTTRPVSVIFFTLAFGLIILQVLATNGLNLRAWLHWPKLWDQWPILRWWVWLIGLGIVSAAITPFYGLPVQALIRLLGYFGIFTTLFMAGYSLELYGIKSIARWTLLGYIPVLAYALVEVLATFNISWAYNFILWFRAQFIYSFPWGNRLSLMATEPSFVAFQILLIGFLLPYVTRWLRWVGWVLIVMCLVFSESGTVIVLAAITLVLWGLFSLNRRTLSRLAAVTTGLGGVALLANAVLPLVQQNALNLAEVVFSVDRMEKMMISFQIRYHYILNLGYAILDTKGLGLGIGQYGYFWKEIYLRFIDYRQFDPTGEMAKALSSPGEYMKPWSVILGIGVDLGLIGLGLLTGFFWQIYRCLSEPRQRALFFACLVALAGAYPIITPHVWLTLVLMAGIGMEQKRRKIAG